MQIDFHHTATYVVARLAGFDHNSAEIVAHAAQYVDDSTTSGFLRFNNGMRFQRDATAHPMLDPENYDNDLNSLSWLPFHFIPGADQEATNYYEKLVCRPDSPIARAMMASAIRAKDRPHGLHRLGIAAHVFVDTFAHQGFVGQRHQLNRAADIRDQEGTTLYAVPVPPIGHGLVGTYPDQPYLKWSYTDSKGTRIARDNPIDFTMAADRLCQEFQRYLLGKPDADVPGLGKDKEKFTAMFLNIKSGKGDDRHDAWKDALQGDHFGLGAVNLTYEGTGYGSWKHHALGDHYLQWQEKVQASVPKDGNAASVFQRIGAEVRDHIHKAMALADRSGIEPHEYQYSPDFLTSNYKLFHNAARDQRHAVFVEILPAFGIVAA